MFRTCPNPQNHSFCGCHQYHHFTESSAFIELNPLIPAHRGPSLTHPNSAVASRMAMGMGCTKKEEGENSSIDKSVHLRIHPFTEIVSPNLVKHNCIRHCSQRNRPIGHTYIKIYCIYYIKRFMIRYRLTQLWSLRSPTIFLPRLRKVGGIIQRPKM